MDGPHASALKQLHGVEVVYTNAAASRKLRPQAIGKACVCQQALGLRGVVLIRLCPRAELIEGQRPLS
jgi:hypothetical protein